jgi:HlyD family secretion protein
VHQPNGLSGALYVPAPIESAACDRSRKSGAVVAQARRRVTDAQAEVRQAQRRRVVEHSRQLVDIGNAERAARAAEDEAKDSEKTHPDDIAEQQAAVADAQTDVDTARRDVENTVLRATVAGTVSAINGTVGEYISSGSDTTPLAPGGRVGLPDVTSGAGGKDDSGSHAQRPGGGSFMVLDDVNTFQVVVPLEEADAAKVSNGQAVDVTFDSLPGLTTKATVTAMSPTGTSIKDVTNYYATMVLNQLDPRLKDGLTAQANIIVGEVGNVLVVPNSAVQQGGDSGLVTVVDPSGVKRQVQVQLGMVGDGVTQVISGLREGQDVATGDS